MYHPAVFMDCERQGKIFVIAVRVNCVLGPSKSICYSGDFVIAGFIIAGFVIAGFVITGFVIVGFIKAGCHCCTSCRVGQSLLKNKTAEQD